MKEFVKTDDFKSMNLGFALDEGKFIIQLQLCHAPS